MRWGCLGALLALVACGEGQPADARSDFETAAILETQGQAVSVLLEPSNASRVAIRVEFSDSGVCVGALQLGALSFNETNELPKGRGAVVWMLPMPQVPLSEAGLPLRLATFDCDTGAPTPTPGRYRVWRMDYEPHEGPVTLGVRVHQGPETWSIPQEKLRSLLRVAGHFLSAADIQLELVGVDDEYRASVVTVEGPDLAANAALARDVPAIDIFLVACLRYRQPVTDLSWEVEGYTLRSPGGLTRMGYEDAVFLQYGSCLGDPWYAEGEYRRARVLAHEIGHALGLRHSVESDGREDDLEDTGDDNLMHWAVGERELRVSEALSASQVERVRAHPLLRPR